MGKLVGKMGKTCEKDEFSTRGWMWGKISTKICTRFARGFTRSFAQVFHRMGKNREILAIDGLLNFLYLVTESKVKFEVVFDFLDAVHYGGMVRDADSGGNFGGTHGEFFR